MVNQNRIYLKYKNAFTWNTKTRLPETQEPRLPETEWTRLPEMHTKIDFGECITKVLKIHIYLKQSPQESESAIRVYLKQKQLFTTKEGFAA